MAHMNGLFHYDINHDIVKLHLIDAEEGDCILIQTKDKNIMIDNGNHTPTVLNNIASSLKKLNVTHIDSVIITHPHPDHHGNLVQMLARDRHDGSNAYESAWDWYGNLTIGEVYVNGLLGEKVLVYKFICKYYNQLIQDEDTIAQQAGTNVDKYNKPISYKITKKNSKNEDVIVTVPNESLFQMLSHNWQSKKTIPTQIRKCIIRQYSVSDFKSSTGYNDIYALVKAIKEGTVTNQTTIDSFMNLTPSFAKEDGSNYTIPFKTLVTENSPLFFDNDKKVIFDILWPSYSQIGLMQDIMKNTNSVYLLDQLFESEIEDDASSSNISSVNLESEIVDETGETNVAEGAVPYLTSKHPDFYSPNATAIQKKVEAGFYLSARDLLEKYRKSADEDAPKSSNVLEKYIAAKSLILDLSIRRALSQAVNTVWVNNGFASDGVLTGDNVKVTIQDFVTSQGISVGYGSYTDSSGKTTTLDYSLETVQAAYSYSGACIVKAIHDDVVKGVPLAISRKMNINLYSFRHVANNSSICGMLKYYNVRIFLTGDCEESSWFWMYSNWSYDAMKCDILKVPHHLVNHNNEWRMIQRARPSVTLIPCGTRSNSILESHPTWTTVQRYIGNLGIDANQMYCTKFNGMITVTTDGNSYLVETERNDPTDEQIIDAGYDPTALQFKLHKDDGWVYKIAYIKYLKSIDSILASLNTSLTKLLSTIKNRKTTEDKLDTKADKTTFQSRVTTYIGKVMQNLIFDNQKSMEVNKKNVIRTLTTNIEINIGIDKNNDSAKLQKAIKDYKNKAKEIAQDTIDEINSIQNYFFVQ